jgi:hypothetical protein
VLAKQLAKDEAIAAADTLLLTVPNQLGVEYNAHVLESILKYVAPGARLALNTASGILLRPTIMERRRRLRRVQKREGGLVGRLLGCTGGRQTAPATLYAALRSLAASLPRSVTTS